MKQRTGVEWAVIVMAVVVVLLAIALIVVNAAGIRIHKPAPEAPAAQADSAEWLHRLRVIGSCQTYHQVISHLLPPLSSLCRPEAQSTASP